MINIIFHYNNETCCCTIILHAYARTMRTLTYPSNSPFITATKYAIFIHYVHLLCFAYMFRCYIIRENLCALYLKTRDVTHLLSVVTTKVVANYKMYNFSFTEVAIFIQWLKSQVLQCWAVYLNLKNLLLKLNVCRQSSRIGCQFCGLCKFVDWMHWT